MRPDIRDCILNRIVGSENENFAAAVQKNYTQHLEYVACGCFCRNNCSVISRLILKVSLVTQKDFIDYIPFTCICRFRCPRVSYVVSSLSGSCKPREKKESHACINYTQTMYVLELHCYPAHSDHKILFGKAELANKQRDTTIGIESVTARVTWES